MAKELVGAVASAVVERLLAARSGSLPAAAAACEPHAASPTTTLPGDGVDPWLVDSIVDEILSGAASAIGGAQETDELSALADSLTDSDIEALAAQVADELAPLLDREELPADKVEI